ncbi:hypothetical protein [Neobacillus sp. Marseille-QA0830]
MKFILNKNLSLFFLLIIVSILSTGCGSTGKKVESTGSVKQKVIAYLSEKGYKDEDYSLTVEYEKLTEGKIGSPFAINVTFNDESDVIYNYKYNTHNGEITQIGVSPLKGRPANDKNFKHLN